jgi:hypothetical protein
MHQQDKPYHQFDECSHAMFSRCSSLLCCCHKLCASKESCTINFMHARMHCFQSAALYFSATISYVATCQQTKLYHPFNACSHVLFSKCSSLLCCCHKLCTSKEGSTINLTNAPMYCFLDAAVYFAAVVSYALVKQAIPSILCMLPMYCFQSTAAYFATTIIYAPARQAIPSI